jgi:hypothetical protein
MEGWKHEMKMKRMECHTQAGDRFRVDHVTWPPSSPYVVLTVKVGRLLEGGVVPVEVASPAVQVGVVVADSTPVGLEVDLVDGVVAN